MKPQESVCLKCQKDQHSEKLWEMHALAVEQGRYCSEHGKKENLYPITLWTAGRGIARVCRIKTSPPFENDVEIVPIYMSCAECGLYLGNIEEDHADVLGQMCLECFTEQTGQEHYWYSHHSPSCKKGVCNC